MIERHSSNLPNVLTKCDLAYMGQMTMPVGDSQCPSVYVTEDPAWIGPCPSILYHSSSHSSVPHSQKNTRGSATFHLHHVLCSFCSLHHFLLLTPFAQTQLSDHLQKLAFYYSSTIPNPPPSVLSIITHNTMALNIVGKQFNWGICYQCQLLD
jgi:hypothetical protein